MKAERFVRDPVAACFLADRYRVRFNQQKSPYAVFFCHESIAEDRCNSRSERYLVHPEDMALLEALPEPTRAALLQLGLWPETDEHARRKGHGGDD